MTRVTRITAGPQPPGRNAMDRQSQIVKLPDEPYQAAIRQYAREGAHIPGDDASNPFVPFGDTAAIKHLCFDVRTNSVANILWVKGGGRIGTHKHRGVVSAITLEGSWGYY